ncbi:hypothetical protein V2J09_020255 [Rumex salicifolius]
MDPVALELERYRRDRQKLLEFIISSNLISEVHTPEGGTDSVSAADLDSLSADYVLHCVNSGGVLDVSEGTENFYLESDYPIMAHSKSRASFFTLSDPNQSGSPPQRDPPAIDMRHNHTQYEQPSGREEENVQESSSVANSNQVRTASHRCLKPVRNVPSLGLPPLKTGMSDDDLRESAYEILLGSMVFSGIEVLPNQDKVKDRSSKLLSSLKSKKDRDKVSEAMDLCIRKKLTRSISRLSGGQISIIQIILGLMNNTSRSNFHNEKSYMHWNKRQAIILEELLCTPINWGTVEHATIKYSIEKIRNAREWNEMSPNERAEVLTSLRNSALKIPSLPGNGQSIRGQSSFEAAGYHLKIRLYEKLLSVVFDILDEAELIAEADDVMKHIKLTWSTLGITETIHDTLFGWVLFKQFVQTDEYMLLDHSAHQLQKVLASDLRDKKERQYQISMECGERTIHSSLVPAIFFSITLWCDGLLLDYHMHFSQRPSEFRRLMNFSLTVGVFIPNKDGEIKRSGNSDKIASKRLKTYIQRSVKAAYVQVVDSLDLKSNVENMHPLVLLADNLKLIIRKEVTVFCPVMHQWYPETGKISSTVLHQLFGERLKPLLQDFSSLSQDAKSVFSAAYMLDQELSELYMFASKGKDTTPPLNHVLDHYNIGEISGPLVLDWVISQHTHILDWIGRAFNLENWEPLSSQQKLALSVVEVFRMIEETIAQFFGLNLPVNITHLQALLSVTFHSLDAYLTKAVNQLVEKSSLYPHAPSLTRYEEMMVPIVRKKLIEPTSLDEKVADSLNNFTLPKLCIRLNTVNYIKNQVRLFQDAIRKSWGLVKPAVKRRWFNIEEEEPPEVQERTMSTNDESINELLETTFDGIRIPASDAINKIVDFIGARAVFVDMREPLLSGLYRGSVEGARMDNVLPHVDNILNRICNLVDDTIRDPVALSIFRALLEAFVWVLLDGGPSRAFSSADISLMEDDLNILKDFFIAEGEGLPRSLVEKEAKFAHEVLSLFSHQTGSIIQMLMTASENISLDLELQRPSRRRLDDANTLIRVLCHKKDREASKFLHRRYGLPASSAYDGNPASENSSLTTASVISDLLKRSASIRSTSSRWSEAGQSSFRSLKERFQGSNLGW